MFKLQPAPTFKADIKIPTAEGEGVISFVMKYRSRTELTAFYESMKDADGKDKADKDILADVIMGWDGIDAEYNKKALATLIDNYPGAALAMLNGYTKALVEGQVKN